MIKPTTSDLQFGPTPPDLLVVTLSAGGTYRLLLRDVILVMVGVEDAAPDLNLTLRGNIPLRIPNPTDEGREDFFSAWPVARDRF